MRLCQDTLDTLSCNPDFLRLRIPTVTANSLFFRSLAVSGVGQHSLVNEGMMRNCSFRACCRRF